MTDESGILRRLPELDTCEPDAALNIYGEISDALLEALGRSDGSVSPS